MKVNDTCLNEVSTARRVIHEVAGFDVASKQALHHLNDVVLKLQEKVRRLTRIALSSVIGQYLAQVSRQEHLYAGFLQYHRLFVSVPNIGVIQVHQAEYCASLTTTFASVWAKFIRLCTHTQSLRQSCLRLRKLGESDATMRAHLLLRNTDNHAKFNVLTNGDASQHQLRELFAQGLCNG